MKVRDHLKVLAGIAVTLLAAGGCQASSAEEADVLRLLVETPEETDPAAVEDRLAAYFDGLVRSERLFPGAASGDPDGLSRMFLAFVPRQDGELPWDTANRVREALAFAEVVPDQRTVLEEGLESSGSCTVETPPPSDRRWSLSHSRIQEAWAIQPPPGGKRFGEGVRICHPDTGWSDHQELDPSHLDLRSALNLLPDGEPNAKDPLDYQGPLLNPGHGTATGTVIVSSQDGTVSGAAPGARLVPIRTAKSVVQVFDSDLARAVDHAVDVGCDVISMSLGGRGFFGLQAAIRRAVRRDVLVMAAAGNCVGFVVAPALYPETLAVGGSSFDDDPWPGSSRGNAVDVSAAAEHVWTARRRTAGGPQDELYAGQGTSFAVATLAGSAAVWLAFHDPEALRRRYGEGVALQEVFRTLAKKTARVPAGWDRDRFGAGILDLQALLSAPLPDPAEFDTGEEASREPGGEALDSLSRMVGRPPREMRFLMAQLFGVGPEEVAGRMDRWGLELMELALRNPPRFERLLKDLSSGEESEGFGPEGPLPGASGALGAALRGSRSEPGGPHDERPDP